MHLRKQTRASIGIQTWFHWVPSPVLGVQRSLGSTESSCVFRESGKSLWRRCLKKKDIGCYICNNNTRLLVLPFRLNKMMHMKGGACVLPLRGTLQMLVFCLPFPFLLILWDSSLFSLVCLPVFPAFVFWFGWFYFFPQKSLSSSLVPVKGDGFYSLSGRSSNLTVLQNTPTHPLLGMTWPLSVYYHLGH